MDQQRLFASDLLHLAPELTLVIFAIALSLLDLLLPKRTSRNVLGTLALVGIIISALLVALRLNVAEPIILLNQSYRIDDFANLFKLVLLTGSALIILMSIGSVKRADIPHKGEFYYLFLPAVLGGMVMASSGDLITLFVGLELLSITSYILVGMRKASLQSNEGAFKYIVTGSIASAFLLYGMSFLYGMSGTTNIGEIREALVQMDPSFTSLIYVSFFLMLAGFGFKVAAAPFHTWAPDVYQGAPTPVAAFLAVVSKAAGFAIIFRVMYSVFYGVANNPEAPLFLDMFLAVTVLAAIAMIVGNTLALKQRNMKRLLAYSGIANAGYLLVPIGTHFGFVHYSNFAEFMFFMIAYLFMNIGAFAVLLYVSQSVGHEEMKGFSGLYYRAPFTAAAMVILLLSLAGLPITGGFFGKLYIILGTLQVQVYWLAAIMIATSIMSFYYYFSIIRQMFMRNVDETSDDKLPAPLGATIWICAIATLLLGFFPHWVIGYIEAIFQLTVDFFI
jgi:NADH-quinone oxidoreductase subunit N